MSKVTDRWNRLKRMMNIAEVGLERQSLLPSCLSVLTERTEMKDKMK